jgi:mono/diheme cytochrome c family protein
MAYSKVGRPSNASVLCATLALSLLGSAASAETLAQVRVPSGSDLFHQHCAQCHGADGKGDGAMAKILTVRPANLTQLSKKNGGKFPAENVASIIRYGGDIQGHGDRQMPIWGKVFSSEGGSGKSGGAYSRRAVVELKSYIESIQQK